MKGLMFIKSRIRLVLVGIFAALAVVGCGILAKISVKTVEHTELMTVVIDAGHGGVDGGVSGVNTGAKESELNLAVAKLIREDFENAGFKTVLTRSGEDGLYGNAHSGLKRADMLARKKIILEADPDIFISVHMNKCPLPSRRGGQVFFKEGDEEGKRLAESIQTSINGLKEASRECFCLKGDYYVLNVSPCPAALVECGFLSNAEDEALLVDGEYRERLAYAIFKGVIGYYAGVRG